MDDQELVEVLKEAARAVGVALADLEDWGLAGTAKVSQYRSDLVADEAALAVLHGAGLGVLSEESGLTHGDREIIVALDPVDGSTNAARGIPWFATSLGAVDPQGLRAAVVVNQASGVTYDAYRGGGARRNGQAIKASGCQTMSEAIVVFSGYPPERFGWNQYRSFGAAALDLCAVAEGMVDGFSTIGGSQLGCWDYLGAMLVCQEAGAVVDEIQGLDLVTLIHDDRRQPVAAATSGLLVQLRSEVVATGH